MIVVGLAVQQEPSVPKNQCGLVRGSELDRCLAMRGARVSAAVALIQEYVCGWAEAMHVCVCVCLCVSVCVRVFVYVCLCARLCVCVLTRRNRSQGQLSPGPIST